MTITPLHCQRTNCSRGVKRLKMTHQQPWTRTQELMVLKLSCSINQSSALKANNTEDELKMGNHAVKWGVLRIFKHHYTLQLRFDSAYKVSLPAAHLRPKLEVSNFTNISCLVYLTIITNKKSLDFEFMVLWNLHRKSSLVLLASIWLRVQNRKKQTHMVHGTSLAQMNDLL